MQSYQSAKCMHLDIQGSPNRKETSLALMRYLLLTTPKDLRQALGYQEMFMNNISWLGTESSAMALLFQEKLQINLLIFRKFSK